MVFEISRARREVLEKLAQDDWTPSDLARELDKSTSAIYNHLDDLAGRGLLIERQVAAKTRPKTEYSIGPGFIQYVCILPGQYRERSLRLTAHKQVTVRIWNVPQEEFHPFLEQFWLHLRTASEIALDDVTALAVYGSVARGTATEDSDVDLLVVATNDDAAARLTEAFGTIRLEDATGASRIGMTEVYTRSEYHASLEGGSTFLESITDELHVLYDPDGVFRPSVRDDTNPRAGGLDADDENEVTER